MKWGSMLLGTWGDGVNQWRLWARVSRIDGAWWVFGGYIQC